MCGKNLCCLLKLLSSVGSPPRVREELTGKPYATEDGGITPACAGRTDMPIKEITYAQDHPRVCGKNGNSQRTARRIGGSPPRVREELFEITPHFRPLGITPACAGRTKPMQQCGDRSGDHPRVCGKNLYHYRA